MTSVVIANKCELTPCSVQIFQGRYESSECINTVQFYFLNMNIVPSAKINKKICWVALVVLLLSAGERKMKCVIHPFTVFKLVLCFQNLSWISGVCCVCRVTHSTLDSCVSHTCPLVPTWGAAPALGQGPRPALGIAPRHAPTCSWVFYIP